MSVGHASNAGHASHAGAAGAAGHADGLLDLRFVRGSNGRTELAERAQRFPLRLTTPMYLDPADRDLAFVYVQNPTGGLFGGDRLLTRLRAGPGARVHLTTQAATKAYSVGAAGAGWQRFELELGEGAFVEYAPDPLIPQAGARVEQELAVSVGEGAVFLGLESLAPGRLARGEAFAYDSVSLAVEVRGADGKELCVETLLLEPGRRLPTARGLLGSYPYLGSLLAVAPGCAADRLAEQLDDALVGAPDALAGAGALPAGAGAFARILARSPGALREALDCAWTVARESLVGLPLPPRRK